jgi:hypothetical protein
MKLLNLFNWVESLISFFTLSVGGGGGGGSQTSTGTTYTSNLPEYAKPFFEEAMKQSAKNVFTTDSAGNVTGVKPMPVYTGERVAGFTPGQTNIQNQIAGLQMPGGFQQATQGLNAGQTMGLGAGASGLSKALGYVPSNIYGGTFTPGMADFYGDPYQQRVTDIALRETRKQGDLQKQEGMMGAIKRGTFGGARQGLIQAEQDRNLMQTLGDIQAKGSQAGFQSAQQQFNADAARQLQAQQANQAAQQGAAQLAGQMGLGGLSSGLEASKAQAATAAAEQTANLERLKTQAASEGEKQALQQKINDLKYQTAMEAQNWEKAQLEFYNAMLRGTPGLASTQIQYAPQVSGMSQLGGLGLGALGLSKALG